MTKFEKYSLILQAISVAATLFDVFFKWKTKKAAFSTCGFLKLTFMRGSRCEKPTDSFIFCRDSTQKIFLRQEK